MSGYQERMHVKQGSLDQSGQTQAGGSLPMLLQLQSLAGNSAVTRLVAQRQSAPPMLSSYPVATTVQSYIELVRELERQFPDKNSLDVLAMLRQAYYGKPWSVSKTRQWDDVLPGSGNPGNPTDRIGTGPGSLWDALQKSQVVGGTDMGHIFTGLQAFFNKTSDVDLTDEILGIDVTVRTVDMPNTEFATWGGDLGAAAGQPIVDDKLDRPVKKNAEYFTQQASDADLEGDIDAYAMVTGAGGAYSLRTMLQMPGTAAPGTPVSQVLYEYFLGSSRLAGARSTKYRDFAVAIGCTVTGKKITNRATVQSAIAPRVADFADMYFWGKYKAAEGTLDAALSNVALDWIIRDEALEKAKVMVGLFLDWLEARL